MDIQVLNSSGFLIQIYVPIEIFRIILSKTGSITKINCSNTCKLFRNIITDLAKSKYLEMKKIMKSDKIYGSIIRSPDFFMIPEIPISEITNNNIHDSLKILKNLVSPLYLNYFVINKMIEKTNKFHFRYYLGLVKGTIKLDTDRKDIMAWLTEKPDIIVSMCIKFNRFKFLLEALQSGILEFKGQTFTEKQINKILCQKLTFKCKTLKTKDPKLMIRVGSDIQEIGKILDFLNFLSS